ncbi:ABC transporter substrate-binding protein [Bradyrhizobium jicamae]|uniref:ABC transporter substrate-binding protein n=1 Tax=Bradyrhizobium jicamae TaxID=280332 RepID=UPI001BACF7EA|nr:ABC transporter substrate-binding protein [Bradyrhizobium jicamae]MBR0939047.1 ABC transporter substrate-binding protein [Bradyrhizobium jicamae]
MQRRDFIALLAGSLAELPLAAKGQQPIRRVGVLINRAAGDPEEVARVDAFSQAMAGLGWVVGGNLQIEYRYAVGTAEAFRKAAVELIDLKPDILLASGALGVAAVQKITRSIPVVFASVADPVGAGIVESLAKPGGNITGFMVSEYSFNTKLLELLKQILPNLTRAAILRNSENPTGTVQFGAIQAVAPSLGVEVVPVNMRDAGEIERTVAAVAQSPNCGLIVTGSASATIHLDLIISLAAQYKLPAVYPYRYSAVRGGLISYGPDLTDQYGRAAAYVDRILKGEKPGDLPVQAPTKYLLVVNLRTAKALGLRMPSTLLARADEVIE